MLTPVKNKKLGNEGYIYVSYGHPKYLQHAVASVTTLRRYDTERPVAIVCTKKHQQLIKKHNLSDFFDLVFDLPEEHASIVGFKHNFYNYLFFENNLFLDSDIIWCKNPDPLWEAFRPFDFTVTGTLVSDNFFGAPKSIGVVKDILLRRRTRTLKRFGLSYLSRAQTGIMYSSDYALTKKTCELAKEMLKRKSETHFQSRKKEKGRTEESCEWSLAMAMSKLNIPVYPWFQGLNSPQLDYIEMLTDHDKEFEYVNCKYYSHRFVYSLRGLKSDFLKKLLIGVFTLYPGNGDYMMVTPFCLHFGWYHEKKAFLDFSDKIWNRLESGLDTSHYENRIQEADSSATEA
ncbi:hypothetical protein [Gracilimonas mengyeensis]|uniref:Uncharacterized protein n=1 Tax=Gracilimonas mengyeensis TaxID=1302730 RepID=A0A521ABP4_9BACT|nr:hypothetical protein [Gracilimonas mengyeensis]SMO32234.1 hypothetical protein SAMN06265219_10131 [Gracilimonas mengyeensis]